MDDAKFHKIIEDILSKVSDLKSDFISEKLGKLDYVGIYTKDNQEYQVYREYLVNQDAEIVYTDKEGELFHLKSILNTKYGKVTLVKICIPTTRHSCIGYADFAAEDNFDKLFHKYNGKESFIYIEGEDWRLLGLEPIGYDVYMYIPDRALSIDLGIDLQ